MCPPITHVTHQPVHHLPNNLANALVSSLWIGITRKATAYFVGNHSRCVFPLCLPDVTKRDQNFRAQFFLHIYIPQAVQDRGWVVKARDEAN